MSEEFPPGDAGYELRFTLQALEDLGAAAWVGPGDLDLVARTCRQPDLVEKFAQLRSEVPTGTDAPMRNVGRPDIYSLHGRNGIRAVTWFDAAHSVCWFLGMVEEHRYSELEERAANNELLPDVEDLTILFQEREQFDQVVGPDMRRLFHSAVCFPGVPSLVTAGGLLNVEMVASAVDIGGQQLVDLYISVRFPLPAPGKTKPPGWPGGDLLERLAELATGVPAAALELSFPSHVIFADGVRPVRHEMEMLIRVESLLL